MVNETVSNYLDIMQLHEDIIINESIFSDMKRVSNKVSNATYSNLKRVYANNISVMKRILSDNNIPVSKIENEGKEIALSIRSKVSNSIKTGTDIQNQISESVSEKVISFVTNMVGEFGGDTVINKSIIILIIVILINSFTFTLCAALTPITPIAPFIVPICIAPITEEIAKQISIRGDYPWLYTTIFAGTEFAIYIPKLLAYGMSLPAAILTRLVALAFHFATTAIQKTFYDRGIQSGSETEKETGLFVGMTLHCIWNSVASYPYILKALSGLK